MKLIKLYLPIIVFTILAVRCGSENDCCTLIDVQVKIDYRDTELNSQLEKDDLLDPDQIKLYHMIDGDWEYYYQGNLDNASGVEVIEGDPRVLSIMPSLTVSDGYSETKIQFSEDDFDVLKTGIRISGNSTVVTKVWYNGELVWQEEDATDRTIQIIREFQ